MNDAKKSDVFTPDKISEIMASKLYANGSLLEPSVGTGNLLKYLNLNKYDDIDVYEINKNYLDLITNSKINKHNLDYLKNTTHKKYKNIILNPPYIKIQELSLDNRKYIKENFTILNTGLIDIYYAFLIKCIEQLHDEGIMVSITPNSYLYNKSSFKLRKYLFENKLVKEIIDYKSEKVFPNHSVYCCITVFTKNNKEYLTYNDTTINYSSINLSDYNIFTLNQEARMLDSICKISNGVATLRDKIYIHKEKLFDEPCWKNITDGKNMKFIIYPYNDGNIINESLFKKNNPKTYNFLLTNKEELSKRDKGNKKYETWYAFGRTQSLKISKKSRVIYIPTLIDPSNISISIREPTLFQSSLCIEPNKDDDVEIIVNTIKKNINYLKSISSQRSGGWITLSSRNLYKIPID